MPEDITCLAQPLRSLAQHLTAGTSSHGLGLSTAHEIVRLHGDTLHLESVPGEGATFTIEFPVA